LLLNSIHEKNFVNDSGEFAKEWIGHSV